MEWSVFKLLWAVTVTIALVTIHSSHATIQAPMGGVNEPSGSGEAVPGGEMMPAETAEREVVPGEGEIIPGSQLEGENLHNPNPQTGSEHPGEETVIDSPVANVNSGSSPNRGEAPRFISVTDRPHVDSEQTVSIRPLKPPTVPAVQLSPTPPSNVSEVSNSSEVTTGDMTNSSLERPHAGEEIPPHVTFQETTSQVNLQTSMSSSSSIHVDTGEIVATRVNIAESTAVVSNHSDIEIPLPDSDLRLTSRPVIEETETVSETVTHIYTSVNEVTHVLETSEQVVVETRIVPEFTVVETVSLDSNNVTTSNHQDTEGNASQVLTDGTISVISSTSVYQETDMTLSSKDRKMRNKPPKSTTAFSAEQTEMSSSVVVLSRSVLGEQTLSIQDISPSSSEGIRESTSSFVDSSTISPTSTAVISESVTPGPSSSVGPNLVTLPSGSHEIVIQKNSTLSVVGTTTQRSTTSTATTSSTRGTNTVTSVPSINGSTRTSSSKAPTTKQSTTPHPSTLLVSLFRNTSLSTGTMSRTSTTVPYTGDVTLPHRITTQRTTLTTKRKVKPHHESTTTLSTNTSESSNNTVTESPATTNNSDTDNRKKTVLPGNTTSTTLRPGTSSNRPTTLIAHQLTSQAPTTKPPVFAQVKLRMSWRDFCTRERLFRTELQDIFHVEGGRNVSTEQIMLMNIRVSECVDLMGADLPNNIVISFYLVDVTGNYDQFLTIHCENVVIQGFNRKVESYFYSKLVEVKLNTDVTSMIMSTRAPIETVPVEKGSGSLFVMEPGITIAIVIASVGGACCIALIILQVVMRRRNKRLYLAETRHQSFTSMDSIAMASVTKSRPNSGLFNPGLDQADMAEPLFPVNFAGLANRCLEPEILKEEFQFVPNYTPKLSTVPIGAEDKNRYANVIPVPQTRVKLKRRSSQVHSDYINANYVTGFGDDKHAYIATQAPLDCTVPDFWRMVWEQQSRVIIMLTAIEENGHPKCAHYWPDCLGDSLQRYGDFMIHLKKKDVHQEYIVSILELKDIENNLVREVKHCWYTCWPINGTPEPISLVKFILDTRVFYEDSGAPLIVHCSPGTGRTGTLIAIDICMRQYENRHIVDVLNTVYRMRQERAGSVQTKEQYIMIYNALNEYASVLRSPAISAASSSMTLHNVP